MNLTPEEIERYAPYHTFPEFEEGFNAYNAGCSYTLYENVAAQAWDRGVECAMRRWRQADLDKFAADWQDEYEFDKDDAE
jgi:hypothetical protein